jgi:two-component system, LytTR family, sensor kinase
MISSVGINDKYKLLIKDNFFFKIFFKIIRFLLVGVAFTFYHIGFTLVFRNNEVTFNLYETTFYYSIQLLFIYLFYKILSINKERNYIFKILICIIAHYIFFVFFLHFYYFTLFNSVYKGYFPERSLKIFLYSVSEYYFQFMPFAFIYWFYKKSLNNEKEARAKEKENHELQQQKLIAECNFLRTQINPHFLYNTLNFFISKTAAHDENISDGLTKLASIMRYSLTQANSHGQVLLQDEVANMENFIALQQLRYGNTLNMEYTKMCNITTQCILPHLLITLVENAFKHGNTRSTTQPLVISLVVQNNVMQFTVTNAIDKVTLEQSGTNVGLQNFKDRLLIAYNTTCTYTIEASNGIYKAYLQVPLLQSNASMPIHTKADLLPYTNGIVTSDGQLKYIPTS